MIALIQDNLLLLPVLLGFALLIGLTELISRIYKLDTEFSRKTVHIGGGLLCLTFPWVVSSHWVILVIALTMSSLMFLAHHTKLLGSIHNVDRKTTGSEAFPLSIYLTFYIAGEDTWMYICAVIVLAVADGFAALIGSQYGKIRYSVEDEQKSVEGSMVFMLCAFLAIHLPLLLLTDLPRESCVLIALIVAILLTGLEAISLGGIDNLIIPIAVCEILKRMSTKPFHEIVYQNLSLLLIVMLGVLLTKRIKGFNSGGMIAVILFAYACWSLGNFWWAMPILLALVLHLIMWQFNLYAEELTNHIRVRFIVRCSLISFIVLILANIMQLYEELYLVFFASFLTTTMMSFIPSDLGAVRGNRYLFTHSLIVLVLCGLCFGGILLYQAYEPTTLIVAVGIAMICSVFSIFITPIAKDVKPESIWPIQRIGTTALAAILMLMTYLYLLPMLQPLAP